MSQQYTINFTNNSANTASACIFQQNDQSRFPGVMPLAWLTQACHPGTGVVFTWTLDYCFVWIQTGKLTPGGLFTANQILPADLVAGNQVTLDYSAGAFVFSNQVAVLPQDSLHIAQGPGIPLNTAAAGIGMSGAGTFVVQSQPNINVTFTPNTISYRVAFGDYTAGEVLDAQQMPNIAEIAFPPNTYVMYATLNPDNTWRISQSPT